MVVSQFAHSGERYFSGYLLRHSEPADFDQIQRIIKGEGLEESKQEAVYERDPRMVQWGVDNGFFTVIERIARDKYEAESLGGTFDPDHDMPRRIVAVTGAYLLGLNEHGFQRRFQLDRGSRNSEPVLRYVSEVGSTRYMKEWDMPNEEGDFPSNCFYPILVASTVAKIFHRAGAEVAGRPVNVDTIAANVQNRDPLITTMARLQKAPLCFDMIRPSDQLKEFTGNTTKGDSFTSHLDKHFFAYNVANIPTTVNYLLDCIQAGGVRSDTSASTVDFVSMKFRFSEGFMRTMETVIRKAAFFAAEGSLPDPSLMDFRLRLARSIPVNANKKNGNSAVNGNHVEAVSNSVVDADRQVVFESAPSLTGGGGFNGAVRGMRPTAMPVRAAQFD